MIIVLFTTGTHHHTIVIIEVHIIKRITQTTPQLLCISYFQCPESYGEKYVHNAFSAKNNSRG